MRSKYSPLLIVLFLGFLLRIWGVNFGLPFQFHQDEPMMVNHAMAFGTGDLNPHYFIIPPLTSYLLFVFYGLYYLVLNVFGVLKGAEAFAVSFFTDPTPFYLIGRIVSGVIPSLLSILLIYKLASSFFSRKASIYAALVMSVAFLNVVNAHYIYADNLLVMFVILAYIAISRIIKTPTARTYIVAGICTGIAVAAKYNAALLAVPFFLAHFNSGGRKNFNIIVFGSAATAAFIICNPYSVLDFGFFWESVTGRIMGGYMGWTYHIGYSMFEGLGFSATVLGLAGAVIFLLKDVKKAAFLISFPLVFYLHLVVRSQQYSRYALSLMPFFAIFLGFLFYDYFLPKFKSRIAKAVLILISFLVILPTGIKSVKADLLFTSPDTRSEATEWIEASLPPSARIALDHTFFAPRLNQTRQQLNEKMTLLDKQPELKALKEKKLPYQIEALEDKKTYEVYYIVRDRSEESEFLANWPVVETSLEQIEDRKIEYVVLNNTTMNEDLENLQEEMELKYERIAEFNPYAEGGFRLPYDRAALTGLPVGTRELFSRENPGPYLLIYKIKVKK